MNGYNPNEQSDQQYGYNPNLNDTTVMNSHIYDMDTTLTECQFYNTNYILKHNMHSYKSINPYINIYGKNKLIFSIGINYKI